MNPAAEARALTLTDEIDALNTRLAAKLGELTGLLRSDGPDAQARTVAFVAESLGMGVAPCSAKWFRMAEPVCPEADDGQHRCRKTAPHLGHHACTCGNTNVNRHPIDPSRASLPTADTPLRPERLRTPDEIEQT